MLLELLSVLHVISTLVMVAIIWFVQVVHYPLMAKVGQETFAAYERAHVERISWVVVPAMFVELGTALAILALGSSILSTLEAALGLTLLAVIWLSTFLIQVPLHERLSARFDAESIGQLVDTNWVRTLAWTMRGGLVAVALTRAVATGMPT